MHSGYTQRVLAGLREQGLRITPQRIAILNYLEGNTGHPTADEIHRAVSSEHPTLSLATVYNTLDTLERFDAVRAVTVRHNCKHYDPDTSPHHHAICRQCYRIHDVFADLTAAVQLPAGLEETFQVEHAVVHLRGLCRACSPATA